MLDRGYLASHIMEDIPHCCTIIKASCHGCFSGLGAQGSIITAFTTLAAQRCVAKTGVLLSSFQAVTGVTQASKTKVTNNAGRNGPIGLLKKGYKTMSRISTQKGKPGKLRRLFPVREN